MRGAGWIGLLALVAGLQAQDSPALQAQGTREAVARPTRAPRPPLAPGPAEEMAREVVSEMSLARTQPKAYAGFLRRLRERYDGDLIREPGRRPTRTFEGLAALEEAIAFLEAAAPVGPLAWDAALAKAAGDHARDQGRTGEMGHKGSDGSTMAQRIERHGIWLGRIAENIDYGDSEARRIVINLIVDDGVASRGHRRNIFNRDLRVAGAAIGTHPVYRHLCVIDYAGGMTQDTEPH